MQNAVLAEAREIAGASMWAYLATSRGDQVTLRPVHPQWENGSIWIATAAHSSKMRHIRTNPKVALFWHLTDALRHLSVTGTADCVTDAAEKRRMWDVFDYDLGVYFPDGPDSEDYVLLRVRPTRVECWGLGEMGGGTPARVWRA